MTDFVCGEDLRRKVNLKKLELREAAKLRDNKKESMFWGFFPSATTRTCATTKSRDSVLFIRNLKNPIEASDLATLLRQPPGHRLTCLNCSGPFRIEGDISDVADVLSNNSSCHLENVMMHLGDLSQATIDVLLNALSNHHQNHLKYVSFHLREFDNVYNRHPLSESLIRLVEQGTALERITIESFHTSSSHQDVANARRFLDGCFANNSLTHLTLLPSRGGPALDPQLEESLLEISRTLERLEIRVADGWNFSNFARTIKEEYALRSLTIQRTKRVFVPNEVIEEEADAFRTCLENNNKIKVFEMGWGPDLMPPGATPLSEKAQEDMDRISFLVRINNMVKPVGPNDDSWIESISDEDDPSVIYHYLRQHPLLCVPRKNNPSRTWRRVLDYSLGKASRMKRRVSDYLENGGTYQNRKRRALNFCSGVVVGAVTAVGASWVTS